MTDDMTQKRRKVGEAAPQYEQRDSTHPIYTKDTFGPDEKYTQRVLRLGPLYVRHITGLQHRHFYWSWTRD